MDDGAPWTCAACGAGNAAYRRRCLDCGEKRAAAVGSTVAAPPSPSPPRPSSSSPSPARPSAVPLPPLVRRPARSSGPARLVLTALVLALALYGAVTYVAGLP